MRRRHLLPALLLARPARAQRRRQARIALVHHYRTPAQLLPEGHEQARALHATLAAAGWREGENLTITRWTALGDPARYAALCAEVVATAPDVILVSGAGLAREMLAATRRIPLVVLTPRPVENGLAESLARPGGNLTGVSADPGFHLLGKQVEFLRAFLPGMERLALIGDGTQDLPELHDLPRQASGAGLALHMLVPGAPMDRGGGDELVARLRETRADAALMLHAPRMIPRHRLVLAATERAGVPLASELRLFTTAGGLFSYGADWVEVERRRARLVVRILEGASPGELPIEQPVRFDLVVNQHTAQRFGLVVPLSVLAFATEVV